MLVSEPVRGRSRATELPCFRYFVVITFCDLTIKWGTKYNGLQIYNLYDFR